MTLILGSSLGTTAAMFDANAAALEARTALIRYDHRGHGSQPIAGRRRGRSRTSAATCSR